MSLAGKSGHRNTMDVMCAAAFVFCSLNRSGQLTYMECLSAVSFPAQAKIRRNRHAIMVLR
jgi:hypothetical protein